MHVYIPVEVFFFLCYYVVLGAVLYFPLYRWQNRFVSGDHKEWFPFYSVTFLKGYSICLFAWPIILGYNIKTEIQYRKKGYL